MAYNSEWGKSQQQQGLFTPPPTVTTARVSLAPQTAASSDTKAPVGVVLASAPGKVGGSCSTAPGSRQSTAAVGVLQEGAAPLHDRLSRSLKWLRIFQVICTVVFIALAVTVFADFDRVASETYNRAYVEAMRLWRKNTAYAIQVASGAVDLVIICGAVNLTLAIPSLAVDIQWLVFTVSPQRRSRSCAGCAPCCRIACSRFTCDLSWDIVFAVFWLLAVAMSIWAAIVFPGGLFESQCVLAACVSAFHIATAVLSGRVRRQMRMALPQ